MNHISDCTACAYDMDGYCRIRRKATKTGDGRKCAYYLTPAQLRLRQKRGKK